MGNSTQLALQFSYLGLLAAFLFWNSRGSRKAERAQGSPEFKRSIVLDLLRADPLRLATDYFQRGRQASNVLPGLRSDFLPRLIMHESTVEVIRQMDSAGMEKLTGYVVPCAFANCPGGDRYAREGGVTYLSYPEAVAVARRKEAAWIGKVNKFVQEAKNLEDLKRVMAQAKTAAEMMSDS